MKMLTILAAASSLALAACAGEEADPAETDTTAEQAGAEDDAAGGDMTPQAVDVVEAASANDNLSTFLEVAVGAGIGETLAQADGITIFAPINQAFDNVENLDTLRENQEQLTTILERHAVSNRYLSGDIPEGETELQTLSGETLTVINNDGLIRVRTAAGTEAMVVEADIEGDNGVVHAINTVLAQ